MFIGWSRFGQNITDRRDLDVNIQSNRHQIIFVSLFTVLLAATIASGDQAQKLTLSGGSTLSVGPVNGIKITLGQSVRGRTSAPTGAKAANIGFWEVIGSATTTGVHDEPPQVFDHLYGNYPNPFNPSTTVRFSLAVDSNVSLELYDLKGRKVDVLLQEFVEAGAHALVYQPEQLASGVYFVMMRAGSYRASRRLVLTK